MSRRVRRTVRPHPYTASATIPADHNGHRPCICGRAKANATHAAEAVAQVDAAHAEQLRRIGGDQ
ncbi:hypothetical protein AB0M91_19700 [Micromonospora rifamycinica]|uniref:hypothetical protein n=1 Tax=Micromonospora rifamycinica TaxID=291594 RepID=UPI00343A8BBD